MRTIAERLDIGGAPAWNAAMALVMLAAGAIHPDPVSEVPGGDTDPFMGPMLTNAGGIVDGAISAAEARGFTSTKDFRTLVAGGAMTADLQRLAGDVIRLGGGPDKFYELVGLAVAPAGAGVAS